MGNTIPGMQPTYPIRTGRLLLRPFIEGDLSDLYSYLSVIGVVRYLYSEPLTEISQARASLERKMAATAIRAPGDNITLAVVLPGPNRVIGEVMLFYSSESHRQGEISYVFNPAFHGHGYATEAAAAMLQLGFEGLHLHRIVAQCDARNAASERVMLRLGMVREAHFRENEFVKGEWTDELVYALLERNWRQRRTQPAPAGG